MNIYHPLGFFGPSFVGKTTFINYITKNGNFFCLPLFTSRLPRNGEDDKNIKFCSIDNFIQWQKDNDFIVHKVEEFYYANNICEINELLKNNNVIIGFTPDSIAEYKKRLPNIKTVLFWPNDFDDMQNKLISSLERSIEERKKRYDLNLQLKNKSIKADITLIIERIPDSELRKKHLENLMNKLIFELEKHKYV